jgi:hypothetical protein
VGANLRELSGTGRLGTWNTAKYWVFTAEQGRESPSPCFGIREILMACPSKGKAGERQLVSVAQEEYKQHDERADGRDQNCRSLQEGIRRPISMLGVSP